MDTLSYPLGRAVGCEAQTTWDLLSEDKGAEKPQKHQENTWVLAFLSISGQQEPRFLPLMEGKRKGTEKLC